MKTKIIFIIFIICILMFPFGAEIVSYAYNEINNNVTNEENINETNEVLTVEEKQENEEEDKENDEKDENNEEIDEDIENNEETDGILKLQESIKNNTAKAQATSSNIEEGLYVIQLAMNSNLVFDIEEVSKANGAALQIWEKADSISDNKKFEIKNIGDGYYTIEAKHSGKVLDVAGASTKNGTRVQQYESNGSDAQKWIIKDAGNGYVNIISKCNGLYLDVPGANASNGIKMQVYEGNSSNAQKFKLVKIQENKNLEVEEGIYSIQLAINTNMIFDIEGVSKANGATLQIWEKTQNLEDNRKFKIEKTTDGYYTIEAKHSGKVLDVAGASTKNGTKVQQYESNGSDAQKWMIKDAGNGYVNIVSKCNGLYLDVPGANAINGKKLQVYEGNGSNAQKFKLIKLGEIQAIANGTYKIKTSTNQKIGLDIESSSKENKANVQLWTESNIIAKNQRFIVTYEGNGYYEIKAEHSEKVLDVYGGATTNGSNVQQYEANGTDAQKWRIKDNKDGTYSIISKKSGLYLDVKSGNIANGSNIQIYEGNGSNAQKFKFEKVEKPTCKQVLQDGVYKINTALSSNMYLDISEGSYGNTANLQIWSKSAVQQQKFRVVYNQEGYYEIKCAHSGKVLDVYGGSNKNGTNVQQYEANNTEYQKWVLQDAGNGYYYIVSKGAENYLDVSGGATSNGTNVRMYEGNQSASQKFKFESIQIINNDQYNIVIAKDTRKVLDIDLNSSNLQIWELNTVSENQRFTLEFLGDEQYKITCNATGQALTVDNKKVKQASYTGNNNQKWVIEPADNGYYYLRSKGTGLYLDLTGGNTDNGNSMQVYDKNNTQAQYFKFSEIINGNFKTLDENKYPGYLNKLEQIQKAHPNWTINIKYTGLDWNTVINNEDSLDGSNDPYNLTQNNNEWRNGNTNYGTTGSPWYRASRKAIEYMMDPRNSLDETYIFQFQDLSSTSGSYNDIYKMIYGTFLTKYTSYSTSSIINTILSSAKSYSVSPFHIVSRILQEQGQDGGILNGYDYNIYGIRTVKVYNLFNIGASGSGDEIISRGAAYAYNNHWYTPETCINGSVYYLRKNYLDKGQNTLYYQKYNVVSKPFYSNQYMQNIRAANDEGARIFKSYKERGLLESEFTFEIPIYENMPSSAIQRPSE